MMDLLIQPTDHESSPHNFEALVRSLKGLEQKRILYLLLKCLSDTYLGSKSDSTAVSAVAGVVGKIVGSDEALRENLVSWVLSPSSIDLEGGPLIRRAVLAVISSNREQLRIVLEKAISDFGDLVYVKHTPILQQEGGCFFFVLQDIANLLCRSRSSPPARCRICAPYGTAPIATADEVGSLLENHFEPVVCSPKQGTFPRHGRWRVSLGTH